MTDVTPRADEQQPMNSKLLRGAIWIAIGALIASALVCVVWVLIGDQDGIIARAFLTILLLALFAGVAVAESHLAERRPEWLALTSMVTWIVALLVGSVKIWMPEPSPMFGWMSERLFQFVLVIGIMQLALVHVRLFLKASQRYVTTFTRVIVIVTFAMLGALVAMLVFYLTFPEVFDYRDIYWRIVIALAILAAVGTTLIPLLNALFAPRRRPRPMPSGPMPTSFEPAIARTPSSHHPATPPVPTEPLSAWPTYSDGRTPLPVMPDGSPDWGAYYTGYPTPVAPSAQVSYYASRTSNAPVYPVYSEGAAPASQAPASQAPDAVATPPVPPAPPAPPAPGAGQ